MRGHEFMKRTTLAAAAVASLLLATPSAVAGPEDPDGEGADAATTLPDLDPVLWLSMSDDTASAGDVVSRLRNAGTAAVDAVVVTSDGGRAVRAPGRWGSWAVRLPAYTAEEAPPRAAIRVQGAGDADPFNPYRRDFRFGATFTLNAESQGSAADNGNNLIQRGLFNDSGQFKLEVDNRVPVCAITGGEGTVVARAEQVQAQQWYRARCIREGDAVTIRVTELTADGSVDVESTTARGAIGSVAFDANVPLSVGGKLDASGDLVRSSGDQFNGVVDNVYYDSAG
jgi:hypothetical protein